VSAAIAADLGLAGRFPYQSLYPRSDVLGLGILSRFPLSGVAIESDPSRLTAMADTPIGRIRIANVHPLHDEIVRGAWGVPTDYPAAERRASLTAIREEFVETDAAIPTLVIGDINTGPTEPAFGWFTAGLRDAHAEVGAGPGWTYRPDALEPLGIGLLRIDVVLTGPGLRPVAESTVCPSLGDHCAVTASLVADPSD
jgi:endonuclease/exonuclease/phosphatase (EEP) superfamily protein YafD